MRVVSQKQTFTETSKDRVIESLKRRVQSLEEENKKLKQLVAELSLDKRMLQDVLSKKG